MSVCRTCALEKECMLKYDVSARMFCNSYAEKKILTNADRIRTMTDEELAVWIAEHTGCSDWCMLHIQCLHGLEDEKMWKCCGNMWLEWLKQEVNDVTSD